MIFFLTAILIPLAFAQRTCLNHGLMGPTGDKCYNFITALQNFEDAEIVCGMFDSLPVSITSGFESNFVLETAHLRFPGEYWVGLTDLHTENEWRWVDGQISNYSNWGTGFPKNDSSKRCVAVQWSGKWMNVNCSSYSASFVCESVPFDEFRLAKCPPNAIEGRSGCFISNVVPATYKIAQAICGEFGGNLVEVVNTEQAMNLMSIAKERLYKTDYWIGVSDPYDSGTWQFLDGTTVNFTQWADGYPQIDGISFCVASRFTDGKWYNTECDIKKPSVCQQKFATPSDEWTYFAETDSYYKGYSYSSGRVLEFEQICKDQGAHLASIHSFRENLIVAGTVTDNIYQYVMLGIYFNSSKNALTWMDGTPWNYEHWQDLAHKAYNAMPCGGILQIAAPYNMTWTHSTCDKVLVNHHFVCKKPRVSV